MSVQIIDPQIFSYVATGLEKVATNKIHNEWVSFKVSTLFPDTKLDFVNKIRKFCERLSVINDENYSIRYDETPEIPETINFTHHKVDFFQFVKYLDCIIYNSNDYEEDFSEQSKTDLNDLKTIISELKESYFNLQKEYNNSNWNKI